MRAAHGLLLLASSVVATEAVAANAAYQDYFFAACSTATGALRTRCDETTGGLGNLSGDSESSLNPSQALGFNDVTVQAAQARSQESRERSADLRDDSNVQASPPTVAMAAGPFSLLVHGRAAWFERDRNPADDAERGYEGDSWAAELGFDYRVSETVVLGALLAHESASYDFDAEQPGVNFTPANNAGSTETDSWSLTVFGTFNLAAGLFADVSAGYVDQSHTFTRNSVFQESGRIVPQTEVRTSGDTEGHVMWLGLNTGYEFARGSASFGPYAGATFARAEIDGYQERDLTSSGLAMRLDENTRDSLLGHVGFRVGYAVSTARAVMLPQVRIELQHEFEDDRQQARSTLVEDSGGNQFLSLADSPDSTVAMVGAGITAILPNGLITFLNYDVLLEAEDFSRQRVTLGIRKEF